MHPKVEEYLQTKRKEAAATAQSIQPEAQRTDENASILIRAGLYETVYAPEGVKRPEGPFADYQWVWDPDTQTSRLGKKVPLPVTAEELAEIRRYLGTSPAQAANALPQDNPLPVPAPKTAADLKRADTVAQDLWKWASRIETWGGVLLALLLFAGFFVALANGYPDMAETFFAEMTDSEAEFNIGAFLITAATWAFYAVVEYCVYRVIALLLRAAACVVQNTKITAGKALLDVDRD